MINLSSLKSDEWATDEKLAEALGVKKKLFKLKFANFKKKPPIKIMLSI